MSIIFIMVIFENRNALSLRYMTDRMPLNTACTYHCGTLFLFDYVMVCPYGDFPIIRHNEVRDLTAKLLTEICHIVASVPSLLERLSFLNATTNTADDARLDVEARGWCRVRVHILMQGCFILILPRGVARISEEGFP